MVCVQRVFAAAAAGGGYRVFVNQVVSPAALYIDRNSLELVRHFA